MSDRFHDDSEVSTGQTPGKYPLLVPSKVEIVSGQQSSFKLENQSDSNVIFRLKSNVVKEKSFTVKPNWGSVEPKTVIEIKIFVQSNEPPEYKFQVVSAYTKEIIKPHSQSHFKELMTEATQSGAYFKQKLKVEVQPGPAGTPGKNSDDVHPTPPVILGPIDPPTTPNTITNPSKTITDQPIAPPVTSPAPPSPLPDQPIQLPIEPKSFPLSDPPILKPINIGTIDPDPPKPELSSYDIQKLKNENAHLNRECARLSSTSKRFTYVHLCQIFFVFVLGVLIPRLFN